MPDVMINGRFKVISRLGGGAFGDVYKVLDVMDNTEYAAKLEHALSESGSKGYLSHEAQLYAYLNMTMTVGLPRSIYYGSAGDYNILVIDLLGPSLEDLLGLSGGRMSLKTIIMLAVQMISRLEFIHHKSYIHRDLKPENFTMGIGKRSHHCNIIDFGLAKRYRDLKTGEHIEMVTGKSLTGTARYVSINTHEGLQQARRDDMEGLAYVMLYLLRGKLPWMGGPQNATKAERYERIANLKKTIGSAQLVGDDADCFLKYLNYSKGLGYMDEPDYEKCREFFEQTFDENGYTWDYRYSWLPGERATKDSIDSSELHPSQSSDAAHTNSTLTQRTLTVISMCTDRARARARTPQKKRVSPQAGQGPGSFQMEASLMTQEESFYM
jgi:casein kinase 1